MSTDEYVPSDPPTVEDWQHLEQRAESNRLRARRGLGLGIISLVLAVAVLVSGAAIYLSQRDVPKVLDKVNGVVHGLEQAEQQRKATSHDQAVALAIVVEGIAGGFATKPAPDPDRLKAVGVLCGIAKEFRQSVHAPLVACPLVTPDMP